MQVEPNDRPQAFRVILTAIMKKGEFYRVSIDSFERIEKIYSCCSFPMKFFLYVDRMTNDDVLSNAVEWSSKGDSTNLFWVVEDPLDGGFDEEGRPTGLVGQWGLNQVNFDYTSYAKYVKNYLLQLFPLLSTNEADLIKSGINSHMSDIQKNFSEFSFYRSRSNAPNRMIILKRKNPQKFGQYPLFLYFRFGLIEVPV